MSTDLITLVYFAECVKEFLVHRNLDVSGCSQCTTDGDQMSGVVPVGTAPAQGRPDSGHATAESFGAVWMVFTALWIVFGMFQGVLGGF